MTSSKPENKSQSKKSSKLNLSKVKPEIKEKNLWKPILNRKTLRAYKFEFAGFFMAITVVLLSISFLTPAPSDLKMAFAGNN